MSRMLNSPEAFVDHMLEGLCAFAPHLNRDTDFPRAIYHRQDAKAQRVGIATGGGSGHLPLFAGYVGPGLVDSCAVGNMFEGPSLSTCRRVIEQADHGRGVLCLLGNYGGDRMNFAMACEELEDTIKTRTVLGCDDIASAPEDDKHTRRGVAGLTFAYKVAGHAARQGLPLDEVAELTTVTGDRTRTIGAAFGPCHLPGAVEPNFPMDAGQVEMGMGIHGEPGIWRRPIPTADELATEMVERLLVEAPGDAPCKVAVLVNGLGATPLEELLIFYRSALYKLKQSGHEAVHVVIGPLVTSLEMPGVSLSLLWLTSDLEEAISSPATPVFRGLGVA